MDYGTYVNLATFKTAFGLTKTDDDIEILRRLEEASRWADERTGRHYYAKTATRTFTAEWTDLLEIPDLLSVTTLKTDEDGDRVYETTWATTDYDLESGEDNYDSFPKTLIRTTPDGDYTFPSQRRGVEIAGLWGYGNGQSATPYVAAGVTATVATTTGTTLTTSGGNNLNIGDTILVETEQMYIEAGAGTSWTVVRGVNGTTAATHSAAAISVYRYPAMIQDAVLIQAARLHARRDSRFATQIGNMETGVTTIFRGKDEDIEMKLRPFIRYSIGAI